MLNFATFRVILHSSERGDILNDRLSEVRKALGLSMEKFGSRIGLTKSAISKMESGLSGISEQTILSICREFRVDYFWLTEGIGEMFTAAPQSLIDEIAEEYSLDADDKKLVEKYLTLPPEQRQVLKDYLKSIFK